MPVDALRRADEAFLSSTVREVQPIATVDGVALPAAPGPVTEQLAAAFTDLIAPRPRPLSRSTHAGRSRRGGGGRRRRR